MAQPSQLTQHIELFVDSSRSSTQQAASLDAIVSFLKNDIVTIGSLVTEMEMYLTTTDNIIRARGILLLGEVLKCLLMKPLDDVTVHSLITFFADRMADWRALRGALVGCLALIKRKHSGVVTSNDAKAVAQSYLQNLQVQSLAQHDRKLCFELLECLLECYPDALASLGDHLVYGICEAIDGEKDPQCLVLVFHIVEVLVQLFPGPSGPIASFASDLFAILGCYFPIHFTHAKAEDIDVKRDDLSRALMLAFSATPLFEPFVVPLLLEKLSSSLASAKVDSLKCLNYCILKYGPERMAKYAQAIWSSIKDAMCNSGEDYLLSFTPESLDSWDFKKNEIATEAITLLEKFIIQNNDLFLSLIIGDEDVNLVFNMINSDKSYNEIPLPSNQKMHVVGCILYVSAKASVASCNKVFESLFPRLMEHMGLSVETVSGASYSNESCIIPKRPNYGSLYLCIELLEACKDLTMRSEDLVSGCVSAQETWCLLLQRFSAPLIKILSSIVAKSTEEPTHDADIFLGVKGLQILATVARGYFLVSESTFENILMTLASIITKDFNMTLWKLALKALMHIGSFLHAHKESEKELRYMDIVVGKIVSFMSCDDLCMPLPLKLEAISHIGKSGLKYMLRIVLVLEEAIRANLAEAYVQGDLKSGKVILQLLECYYNELLPWFQKNEGFEEVLLRFVVNIWNQIENCTALTKRFYGKELLDAMMKVMKLAVACCPVESQNIIVDKAYSVLSSSTSLLKGSFSTLPIQLNTSEDAKDVDKFLSSDEWIQSLFASVIIALRPQAHIPNIRMVIHLFMAALLKGSSTAAQALGSLVNKLDSNSNGTEILDGCNLEEAMNIIFYTNLYPLDSGSSEKCNGNIEGNGKSLTSLCRHAANRSFQIHAIIGLAWIGKGLLMRGQEKVKDITMVFLECLLSNGKMEIHLLEQETLEKNCEQDRHLSVMKCSADAFQILMSDSELCLNRRFHAIIRPLYKQRFFSTMMPVLQPLIIKTDSSFSRSMLYRAFAHIISDTPLIVILNGAKKLIPILLDALSLLSKDVLDKDIMYSLLLVLSGLLTDKSGQEAVIDNAHIIINRLIGLINYPHMMLVRETAIQCLVAMSELPHARIYPMRIQVLQALSKALDDPKRAVRQEAVRCRQAWVSSATRSLHF